MALDARRIIHRVGEVPAEVYTLFDGWAFRFKLLPDGRRQILSFLLPGDFMTLDALQLQPPLFSVQSLTPVQLCAFDTREMHDFVRARPQLSWNVAAILTRKAGALDCVLLDLGRRTALERVARLLLHIEARLRVRNMVTAEGWPFPLRQEHIADALGLTTVHVSRTIAMLRGEGLVTLGHGMVCIHDHNRLSEISGRLRKPPRDRGT